MARSADKEKAAFASRLRAVMGQRGLTAAETARRMTEYLPDGRASRATISHYRTGRALPRPRYLDALSLALGVDSSELLPLSKTGEKTVRQARPVPTAPANQPIPEPEHAPPAVPRCYIEDLGEEVHLRIDQRVSWEVALKILEALKVGRPTP